MKYIRTSKSVRTLIDKEPLTLKKAASITIPRIYVSDLVVMSKEMNPAHKLAFM